MAATPTPIAAILGVLGSLGLVMGIPRLFARRPTSGPRLKEGELTAGQASARASNAYWQAEDAAARGDCKAARDAFRVAEGFRTMVEDRVRKGDRTGRPLKGAIRLARGELRKCHA